jgi:uncharacterized protein with HEPN domain
MANEDLYLKNILDSISKIERYIEEIDEKSFLSDDMRQDAVIRQLEIVGEASRLLSDEIKDANPKVPWREISGMRNHLIHRYFKVDIEEVWRTAKNDLLLFKTEVEKILEDLD